MSTKVCGNPAALRYTWAGREESFICILCAPRLRAVANALGYPLQMIPIGVEFEGEPRTCSQNVKVEESATEPPSEDSN